MNKFKLAISIGVTVPLLLCAGIASLFWVNSSNKLSAEENTVYSAQPRQISDIEDVSSSTEYPSTCILNPERVTELHSYQHDYSVEDELTSYYLSIQTLGDPSSFSPEVYVGEKCESAGISIANPWSEKNIKRRKNI